MEYVIVLVMSYREYIDRSKWTYRKTYLQSRESSKEIAEQLENVDLSPWSSSYFFYDWYDLWWERYEEMDDLIGINTVKDVEGFDPTKYVVDKSKHLCYPLATIVRIEEPNGK